MPVVIEVGDVGEIKAVDLDAAIDLAKDDDLPGHAVDRLADYDGPIVTGDGDLMGVVPGYLDD